MNIGPDSTCGKALPLQGCYCFLFELLDRNSAQDICNRNGMVLVGLQNQAKETILNSYIARGGYQRQAFWTSGVLQNWPADNNPLESTYSWGDDGTDMFDYTNWCFGQPNNYGGNDEYVVTYNGCWFDTPEYSLQYAICEELDPLAQFANLAKTSPLNKK